MFFTLRNEAISYPLRGIFSSKGLIFFVANDIATILKLKNPSQFALKHATMRVKDVVYKEVTLTPRISKMWLLDYNQSIRLLENGKSCMADRLADWLSNKDSTKIIRQKIRPPSNDFKNHYEIEMYEEERDNVYTDFLDDFFDDYRRECLEYFNKVLNEKKHEMVLNVYGDSLESLEIEEPPPIVRVYFGEEMYKYQIIK